MGKFESFVDNIEKHPQKRDRDFIKMYVILAILFLVMFTMRSTVTILQVFVPDLSVQFLVTEGTIGLAYTTYNLVAAIVSLVIGPIAERLGYKVMIYTGMFIFAVGISLSSLSTQYWMFTTTQALAGVGAAFFGPANIAFAGDYFPEKRKTSAIGLIMSSFYVSSIVAVPINSYIADLLNWRWGVGIMAIVAFLVFALVLFFIPRKSLNSSLFSVFLKNDDEIKLENIEKNTYFQRMKIVLSNKQALGAFFITLFQRGGLFAMTTLLSTWLEQKFGLNKTSAGLIFMGAGIAALISNTIFSWGADKIGKKRIILLGTALTGVWIGVFPLISFNIPIAITNIIVLNFFGGISMGSYNAFTADVIPQSKGTVLAINNAFGQISQAAFLALIGKFIFDYTQEYVYCGFASFVVYLVCFVLMLIFIKPDDKMTLLKRKEMKKNDLELEKII